MLWSYIRKKTKSQERQLVISIASKHTKSRCGTGAERKTTHVDLLVSLHSHDAAKHVHFDVARVGDARVAMAMLVPRKYAEVRQARVVLFRRRHVVLTHALEVHNLAVESEVMRVSGHVADRHL